MRGNLFGLLLGFLEVVGGTKIAPEPEQVGKHVNIPTLLCLTEADKFTQTIYVKGRKVTTATGYTEIQTEVEVSALPPIGDPVWKKLDHILAGRAEGRPDNQLRIHRIGRTFEYKSNHVYLEGENLLNQKQQVCEAGGLKHPLDEREPVVSMEPSHKLQVEESDSIDLLRCLGKSFSPTPNKYKLI